MFESRFEIEYAQYDRMRSEVDRLRAELDRHRVAGDAMAGELEQSTGISDFDVQRLIRDWRSVRSGRGAAVWREAAAEGGHDRDESGVCRECGH